ncbi:MAG: PAS domain-containing protein [Magnetococcales bacterium]|nr:PAS domain-containing protein [Magnetococcales bacterium]
MHRLLLRQFKRIFKVDQPEEISEILDRLAEKSAAWADDPQLQGFVRLLPDFIRRVDESYVHKERDLELRNRSLQFSSDELHSLNQRLRQEAELKSAVISSLQRTTNDLLEAAGKPALDTVQDDLGQITQVMVALVEENNTINTRLQQAFNRLEQQKFALDEHCIVTITDVRGVVTYANKNFVRISGYAEEEMLGKTHKLINSGYHKPGFFETMWQTITAGKVWNGEICNRAKDGTLYWVSATIVPFLDEQGKPVEYVAIRTNITHQKELEKELREKEQRLTIALDASNTGLWDWNPVTDVAFFSEQWLAMLGLEKGTVSETGKLWSSLIHPNDSQRVSEKLIVHLSGQSTDYEVEFRMRHRNGGWVWILSSGRVTERNETGKATRVTGIHKDISDRKKVEEQLKEAKQQAEAASEAKSHFLANMSHEIRTPMNAIIGMGHLALSRETDPRQKDYLRKIYKASQSLLRIINDILDFSKIEAGKLELEESEFCLDEMFETLANQISLKAQEKGLELIYDVPATLPRFWIGDALRINQILLNLTSNAVKFSDKGEIVVRVQSQGENGLCFTIEDSGIGMTEAQVERLFQSFSQADSSTTRRFGGTGLGLAISKKMVALMGGTISVNSELNKGSRFQFTIFLKPGSRRLSHVRIPEILRGALVALLTGNDRQRSVLSNLLESLSFRVQAFSNSTALNQFCERNRADPPLIILLDGGSLSHDPVAFIQHFRHLSNQNALPVLVMSNHNDHQRSHALRTSIPAIEFVQKPITASGLFDGFSTLIGRNFPSCHQRVKKRKWPGDRAEALYDFAHCHILLTEDNPVNRQVAVELLEMVGAKVSVAGNGQEAVNLVAGPHPYDGILMDLQMPVMDGFQATRLIREGDNKNLVILAMTANAMAGDRERCLEAGMNDHIAKPIDPSRLYSTLGKWLKLPTLNTAYSAENGPEEGNTFPEIDGIDIPIGIHHAAGNQTLFRQLLMDFSRDQKEVLEQLRVLSLEDIPSARRLAHTLKGLSGTIGATRLSTLAEEIENRLDTDQGQVDVTDLLARLQSELQRVFTGIEHVVTPVLSDEQKGAVAFVSPEQMRGFLDRLLPTLQKRQVRQSRELLDEFTQFHLPPEWVEHAQNLILHTRKYKFKQAENDLHALQGKLTIPN